MIQKRFDILLIVPVLAIIGISTFLSSCQPSCDSIPTEALAQVRILNAVSNADLILVYVDGKLFDSAWYDVENKYFKSNLNHQFGYRSTFLSDGSSLRAGLHHVVAKAHLIGGTSFPTIDSSDVLLYGHHQSLIYIGKIKGSPIQAPRLIYLDDVVREEDPTGPTFVRFLHAVPDVKDPMDTAGIDIYFASAPKLLGGVPDSGLRMRYSHISHQPSGDNGTGLLAEDYIQLPKVVPGLVVMPIGDTNLNDEIVNFPHALPTNGLLVTIVVRGERWPSGTDASASAIVLEDGGAGTVPFNIQSFDVRLTNATPFDSLSLLIANPLDQDPSIPRSTANFPYPTQQKVLNILRDTVSGYMGLGNLAPYYNFWFASSPAPNDTLFRFTTNVLDLTYPRIPPLELNIPCTFVAIDTIPGSTTKAGISLLELVDTVSAPDDPTMGRVRLVNTTADYSANFTLGGTNFSMKQRDVRYVDVPIGAHSFTVSNGSSSTTVDFNVSNGAPITIFFMPSNSTLVIPYTVSTP